MIKLIYRTGKEMREENYKLNPEWFRNEGDKLPIKHYFRGEPVVRLLDKYRYFRYLKYLEYGFDNETAYFKAATYKIRKYNVGHLSNCRTN